jgi:hypothetical protein
MRLIALTVLAGIIVPASSALAASRGSIGIRLVKGSVDSRNDRRADSYIIHRLTPEASIRRRVEISNGTRSAVDVAVYPAAAALRRGNFAFAAGHGRNELSSWTSVSRGVLHMAPGTKAFETVTIDVPADASSGEQYAVIWAEVSTPAPPGGGVTLINRVGIRMYVTIRPGGAEPSNFVIGALTAERSKTGEPRVVAAVRNTGGRRLALTGELTLAKGPGGVRGGPFPVSLGSTLAPGDSDLVAVRLDRQLPRGPWEVHLRLRSGSIQRVAVATISFPLVTQEPPVTNVDRSALLHLLYLLGGLLVLLAVAVLALLLWRRGAPRPPQPVL